MRNERCPKMELLHCREGGLREGGREGRREGGREEGGP